MADPFDCCGNGSSTSDTFWQMSQSLNEIAHHLLHETFLQSSWMKLTESSIFIIIPVVATLIIIFLRRFFPLHL